MQRTGRIAAIVALAGCACGLTLMAHGQTVENAVKVDVSPPLGSIEQPPKAKGAFFREHE